MSTKASDLQLAESKDLFSPPTKMQRFDSDISFSPSNMLVNFVVSVSTMSLRMLAVSQWSSG